ncbi:MAG: hypothetical protein ABSD89_11365 [Halobacteriota archaeon]|jgi:hypothetical protein
MGKQKGSFPPGKYGHDLRWRVKAVRGKEEPYLYVTMRLTEKHVSEILLPQIQKFLRTLDKQGVPITQSALVKSMLKRKKT